LLARWEKARHDITTGPEFAHRGWYHTLYADFMRGKKIMDVGSGFGVDPITFAQHGAKVTFVDLVEANLKVLERLCKIMGLNEVRFVLFEDLKPEYQELLRHLKPGGRWLQLAYPKSRWIRDRRPPFSIWGQYTDGPGTPWCEPYDLKKLLSMFEPAKFDVVLYQEFHNCDFNWFDLLYQGN
jgi:SAM-dependent methyltransferase